MSFFVFFKLFTKNVLPEKKHAYFQLFFGNIAYYVVVDNRAKLKFKTLNAIFSKRRNATYQLLSKRTSIWLQKKILHKLCNQ